MADVTTALLGMSVFLILLYLVMLLIGLTFWVLTLMREFKKKQWGWFIATIIFPGLGATIYWIVQILTKQVR